MTWSVPGFAHAARVPALRCSPDGLLSRRRLQYQRLTLRNDILTARGIAVGRHQQSCPSLDTRDGRAERQEGARSTVPQILVCMPPATVRSLACVVG
jgi:hypothetical protein